MHVLWNQKQNSSVYVIYELILFNNSLNMHWQSIHKMHTFGYFLKNNSFECSYFVLLQDKEVLPIFSSNVKKIVLNMSKWEKATWIFKIIFIAMVYIVLLEESEGIWFCTVYTCLSCSLSCFNSGFGLGSWKTVTAIHAGMYNCGSCRERKKSLFKCVWWSPRMVL